MRLTRIERQMLANQCAILAKLDTNDANRYEKAREVFQNGYETAFTWYMDTYDDSEVFSEADGTEVINILTMFRIIGYAYNQLEDKTGIEPEAIKYLGFDGNEETGQFGFVKFLKSESKFDEQVGGFDGDNSHSPMLPRYRQIMQEWNASNDKYELTREDIVRIAEAV